MKALRLVFLASVCILIVGSLKAQVKIGDNKLDLGAERLLEIERAGELLIVTDSLELGLTNNQNLNVTTDALMLKLFGYGLEQFTPALTSKTQNFFLASNSEGEVMQIPLVLNLVVADSTTADLSLHNGVDTFGTVDLMMLDSIFATDIALRDSTALLRSLISDSEEADGDTLTGNEWLASVVTSGTELVFTENVTGIDTQHVTRVDLDGIWATDMQLADTATILRNLIDSLSLYTHDGTLEEDRTVTGASNDLTFTGVDTFAVSGVGTTITSTGTNTFTSTGQTTINSGDLDVNGAAITVDGSSITETSTGAISLDAATNASVLADGNTSITADGDNSGAGDLYLNTGGTNVVTVQPNENVLVASATVDTSLLIDNTGNITAEIYGTGTTTGTFANIIGVTADGQLIDVTVADILATDSDSTIYTHNGTLAAERTMWMDNKNLFFVSGTSGSGNTDTITITPDGRMAIGRSYVTVGKDTSSNGIRLDVNGDILAVQVHSSSDERFKKNIKSIESALGKVLKINGVTYDFKNEEFPNRQFPTTRQLGFVAQNVEEVVPEVVKTDAEGYKSIDYAKITALLSEAVKEQQTLIEMQQLRIAKLEAELKSSSDNNVYLKEEIASIKSLLKELVKAEVAED